MEVKRFGVRGPTGRNAHELAGEASPLDLAIASPGGFNGLQTILKELLDKWKLSLWVFFVHENLSKTVSIRRGFSWTTNALVQRLDTSYFSYLQLAFSVQANHQQILLGIHAANPCLTCTCIFEVITEA